MIKEDFFDYEPGYDDNSSLHIKENIPEWQYEEAVRYFALFQELWGLVLISGERGFGKDLLLNYLAWITYRSFDKKLLRDEKPRELFGLYDGIFNEEVLSDQINKMNAEAKGLKTWTEKDELMSRIAEEFVMSKEAQDLFSNSILALTEYWKYVYKREPHKPMNKTMGAIHKMLRHYPSIIFGSIQIISDLDKYTCHPFINYEIRANRSQTNRTGFIYMVYKCKYHQTSGVNISPYPIDVIKLDGARPVTELGMPIEIIDSGYVGSKVEMKLLDAIRSGVVTFEDLVREVKYRRRDDTTVLKVLKYLFMHKPKVINYGCWFNIFNSRSKPQISGSKRILTTE